jgi:hypothetical protein
MGITRAQIARQLLAEGGMSLNDAKAMAPEGEFLAYINPKEANMLKAAGGSGIMTPMGIPSFVDFGGAGSGYGSAQDTFDSARGSGGSRTGPGGGQGPSRSDTGTDTDDIYQQSSETNRAIAKANRSFAQKVADAIKSISRFTPLGLITKGIGNLFNKLGTLRGFNPDGTPRTQAQFEQARRDRQRQNRIANIMGRDAPFTQMTLDNLAKLGYTGPLEGLLGSTNITRSGTTDDVYPNRVDGINATNAATNFIDFNKAISSEDLSTIQQNIKDATGYDTTLAKNYTKQDIENLGAEKGFFGANDQLEALQEYYDAVQKLSGPGSKFAPNNPAKARDFITKQSNIPFGAGSYNIDMGLIPQDFLETQEDLQQQKSPIELLDI